MNIFLCASKHNYDKLPPIITALETAGHIVIPPNSFDEPGAENQMKALSQEEHQIWKAAMLRQDIMKIKANDAILVMNLEKNGVKNYIGGATFLEIFLAFEHGKKIFLWKPIPDGNLKDEILGMAPTVIAGDISKII